MNEGKEYRSASQRNIIVNKTNFDQIWAAEYLHSVIRKDMNALIIPLDHDEGWASDAGAWGDQFSSESDFHYDLERPLRSYGIHRITWIDFHQESSESASLKIRQADLVMLAGDDPGAGMDWIEDLGLTRAFQSYQGLLITVSEISQILAAQFETGNEYERSERDGLALIPLIRFHMHYSETEEELHRMIRYLETDSRPLIVLSEKSGLYIENGSLELLGDAFIAEDSDLDELYSLL